MHFILDFHAGDSSGLRQFYRIACLSVCHLLVNVIFGNILVEILQIWHKCVLGPNENTIHLWQAEVKVLVITEGQTFEGFTQTVLIV